MVKEHLDAAVLEELLRELAQHRPHPAVVQPHAPRQQVLGKLAHRPQLAVLGQQVPLDHLCRGLPHVPCLLWLEEAKRPCKLPRARAAPIR